VTLIDLPCTPEVPGIHLPWTCAATERAPATTPTGASRGLAGYHFRSKQGLTEAVIRDAQDSFVAYIARLRRRAALAHRPRRRPGTHPRIPRPARPQPPPQPGRTDPDRGVPRQPARPARRIHTVNAVLRDTLRNQLARGQEDGSVRQDLEPALESVVLAGVLRASPCSGSPIPTA